MSNEFSSTQNSGGLLKDYYESDENDTPSQKAMKKVLKNRKKKLILEGVLKADDNEDVLEGE